MIRLCGQVHYYGGNPYLLIATNQVVFRAHCFAILSKPPNKIALIIQTFEVFDNFYFLRSWVRAGNLLQHTACSKKERKKTSRMKTTWQNHAQLFVTTSQSDCTEVTVVLLLLLISLKFVLVTCIVTTAVGSSGATVVHHVGVFPFTIRRIIWWISRERHRPDLTGSLNKHQTKRFYIIHNLIYWFK